MNTATTNLNLAVQNSGASQQQQHNSTCTTNNATSATTTLSNTSNNNVGAGASATGSAGNATNFSAVGAVVGVKGSSSTTTSSTATTTTTTTAATNGSISDSLASTDGHRTPNVKHLSKTNLYIKGLQSNTSDQDLYNMCSRFGQISSTKAILEKITGVCRGYGFVEFTTSQSAELAVQELTKSGIQAQMAKISPLYSSHQQQHHHHQQQAHHHHHHHHHNNNNNNSSNSSVSNNRQEQHNLNSSNSNDADPTNLYIANLPPNMSEQELANLLSNYGHVVSTRILRDQSNIPRGVGFARMGSRDKCEQIIEQLNGRPCKGSKEPLLVKFADGKKKVHHHNSQHQHHNNNHHQHHKVHQDDSRWRESSNTSDLGSVSSFDHQGNISHSNHLSDLAMMSTLSYPRIQPGFPPTVATGAAYPAPLGPPTSAPQWIHPGGHGQPYVIPQQMIQAGGLGPSNQAAALHYGHIPQLTSQMQGLQIAHPGAPVGGYLPPQHQWSALWTHPIPQQPQPSMRLPTTMQQLPPSQQQQQQQQQQHQQQSPQPAPVQQQQQPPIPQQQQQQQSSATDSKLHVSMPL